MTSTPPTKKRQAAQTPPKVARPEKNTRTGSAALPEVPPPRRGSSCPMPWSPQYAYNKVGEVVPRAKGNRFRSVLQPKYPKVVTCTEVQAKQELEKHGFLPGVPPPGLQILLAVPEAPGVEDS